jgi:hypothetical protein
MAVIGALLAALAGIFLWNRSLNRLAEVRGRELAEESEAHISSEMKVRERTRLAIELHDALSQNLTGVSLEIETAAKQRSKIVKACVQESLSGESKVDEHGCIGGSMQEHTAEGESLSEHAAHERMRTERLEAEAAIRAADLRKPGLTELRKAVVMAEILDKPVSMRRRRI